jgi:hypothetical protein
MTELAQAEPYAVGRQIREPSCNRTFHDGSPLPRMQNAHLARPEAERYC